MSRSLRFSAFLLKRHPARSSEWSGTASLGRTLYYYYDSDPIDGSYSLNAQGRLAAVRHGIPSSCPVPVGGAIEEYSYNQAGLVTNKRLRSYMSEQEGIVWSSYNYDNEGRQTSGAGGMTYDSMGRPFSGGGITSVTYGPGDEPLQIAYGNNNYVEHRTYNLLGQLSRQTYKYWSTVLADFEYAYVDGANNGRISRFKDWVTGEEVNYLYDSLNRLNRAETTGPEWGQSFTYDGFGNLAAETATKGVAPSYTLQYDWATNRIVSSGFAYDANGNLASIPGIGTVSYDVFNRYQGSTPGTAGRFYRDDNKLLARYVASTGTWEVYYYGPTGLLESVWGWQSPSPGVYTFNHVRQYDYFAGRRVEMGRLTDRLGSVRALVSAAAPTIRLASYSYYPYGQERQVTSDEQYKFATYFRESNGLDYADQRYYHSEWGRFLTPDPYQASAGPEDPESWNRYSYVRNDPINRADPSGLDDISAEFGEILFQITVTEITYPLPSYGGGADRWRSGPNLEMYSDPISYFSSGGGGGRAEEIKLSVSNLSKTGPKQAAIWNTLALMKAAFINGVDPNCEKWLAGVVGHIEQILGPTGRPEDSFLGHGVFSDPRVNAFTGTEGSNIPVEAGVAIVVSDNGAFFSSGQSTANGKIRGRTFHARVFIMLHELAHSLEIKGFKSDWGDDAAEKANNNLVLKNCERMLKWAK